MAAYNEAGVIQDAIHSILDQTYADFEFIIIDDGSQDGTAKIARSFDDDRIRIIENDENMGLAWSLNRGLERAQGEYIARMDADDCSAKHRFARQVEILDDRSDVKVAGCWFRMIGREDEILATRDQLHERGYSKAELIEKGPGIAHGSVMYRRKGVLSAGGYDNELDRAQDFDLWIRMADKYGAGFVHVIPEVLYEYRVTADDFLGRRRTEAFSQYIIDRARGSNYDRPSELNLHGPASNYSAKAGNRRDSAYHYVAGNYHLEENRAARARAHYLCSVQNDPLFVRAWYKLIISVLPSTLRTSISSRVSEIADFLSKRV